MKDWGFWEWLTYVTIAIGAFVLAIETALAISPAASSRRPRFLRSHIWKFIPSLFFVASMVFIAISYLNKKEIEVRRLIFSYGSQGGYSYKKGMPGSLVGDKNSHINLDGRLLDSLKDGYRIVGVCYHYASGERYDLGNLSKSALYDIRPEEIHVVIQWSDVFADELIKGAHGTHYALLAVPIGLTPDQFHTLREAQGLGAKIVAEEVGTP